MKGLNTSLAEHVSQVEVILLNYMTEEEEKNMPTNCVQFSSRKPGRNYSDNDSSIERARRM